VKMSRDLKLNIRQLSVGQLKKQIELLQKNVSLVESAEKKLEELAAEGYHYTNQPKFYR